MITVNEVMRNIGKGQSSIGVKYIIKALEEFYNKIRPKIRVMYASKEFEGVTVFFKIPSEKVNSLYYDICIWFGTKTRFTIKTLLKIYSNSPKFGYNFAYLYNQDEALLFKNKFPKEFLTIPPKTRNPLETKGFDKHVYACLRFMVRVNLNDLTHQFENKSEPFITSFSDKEKESKTKRK